MRYYDVGEIHKDFHLATNRTIDYIMRVYGEDFLLELCKRTAQNIYSQIYNSIKKGDLSELIKHLTYYIEREEGVVEVESSLNMTVVKVVSCPMHVHINSSDQKLSKYMELFLSTLYKMFAENTPFTISLNSYDPNGSYTINIQRQVNHVAQ